jgi:hypothetical protein
MRLFLDSCILLSYLLQRISPADGVVKDATLNFFR